MASSIVTIEYEILVNVITISWKEKMYFQPPRKNVKITTRGINSKASQGVIEEIVYTWAISCDPWGSQNVENWIATWSDDFSRAFLFGLESS